MDKKVIEDGMKEMNRVYMEVLDELRIVKDRVKELEDEMQDAYKALDNERALLDTEHKENMGRRKELAQHRLSELRREEAQAQWCSREQRDEMRRLEEIIQGKW